MRWTFLDSLLIYLQTGRQLWSCQMISMELIWEMSVQKQVRIQDLTCIHLISFIGNFRKNKSVSPYNNYCKTSTGIKPCQLAYLAVWPGYILLAVQCNIFILIFLKMTVGTSQVGCVHFAEINSSKDENLSHSSCSTVCIYAMYFPTVE